MKKIFVLIAFLFVACKDTADDLGNKLGSAISNGNFNKLEKLLDYSYNIEKAAHINDEPRAKEGMKLLANFINNYEYFVIGEENNPSLAIIFEMVNGKKISHELDLIKQNSEYKIKFRGIEELLRKLEYTTENMANKELEIYENLLNDLRNYYYINNMWDKDVSKMTSIKAKGNTIKIGNKKTCLKVSVNAEKLELKLKLENKNNAFCKASFGSEKFKKLSLRNNNLSFDKTINIIWDE